ncbi:MAG: endonuclease/exonuclease/phosphatase family protein [Phycisphaeraceae bacterium]|nr:endonuclease/exonuclease/phosphatase family protein [Phycisphaeraceae bacterium]
MTSVLGRGCACAARVLAWLTRLIGWLVLALWAVGAIASDRWAWSQPLSWIPTPAALVVSGGLLSMAWLLGKTNRRKRRRRALALMALCTWGLCAVSFAYECRVWRYASPASRPEQFLRVLFWNSASSSLEYPPKLITQHAPDLTVFVDLRWGMGREMLAKCVGENGTSLWVGGFSLASRYPITGWGHTLLGFKGVRAGMDPAEDGPAAYDSGEAMFVELDATEAIGRSIVVWILDIPSDPRLHRVAMFRQVLERTSAWSRGREAPGFPAPDLIIGDLNTPRGAASLQVLAPGATSAFSQVGRGWAGSWPRRWPAWHIDHALVGDALRAASYTIVDPGRGTHRMQIVDLTAMDR